LRELAGGTNNGALLARNEIAGQITERRFVSGWRAEGGGGRGVYLQLGLSFSVKLKAKTNEPPFYFHQRRATRFQILRSRNLIRQRASLLPPLPLFALCFCLARAELK